MISCELSHETSGVSNEAFALVIQVQSVRISVSICIPALGTTCSTALLKTRITSYQKVRICCIKKSILFDPKLRSRNESKPVKRSILQSL